jgi:hypothetical protein
MVKKILILSLSLMSASTFTMAQDAPPLSAPPAYDNPPVYEKFRSLDELPIYCLHLVEALSDQPVKLNALPYQELVVENFHIVRLIELMTKLTDQTIVPAHRWHIRGTDHPPRIKLFHVQGETPCSSQTLLEAYQAAIVRVKSNWKRTYLENLMEQPTIAKDENEWSLFIKNTHEHDSISHLLRLLTFLPEFASTEKMECYNSWKNARPEKAYLWIKNDAFDEVQSRLQLNI